MYQRHKQLINWMFLKTKINESYQPVKHFFPRRAIVTVNFGENVAQEKAGIRPALVVSNDANNKYSTNVVVVPLTDANNKKGNLLPTQYRLFKEKYNKLNMDSIVQCEDIRVINKSRVGDLLFYIDKADMRQIEKRLRAALAL